MIALIRPLIPAGGAAVLALAALIGSPAAVLAEEPEQSSCDMISQHLGASYTISSNGRNDVALEFWREANQVLYHYPDRQVADQWTLTRNGYLKPVRYFTEAERAIEYDAFDINGGKGSKDWESRSRWISQDSIDAMQLTGSSGEGCMRVETYESVVDAGNGKNDSFSRVTLSWLPALQLVDNYQVRSIDSLGQRRVVQWQLDRLQTDQVLVEESIDAFDDFASTDYADIGDNESDPFLMKMIKLGFVQHGASGFYDSNGLPLNGGHVH